MRYVTLMCGHTIETDDAAVCGVVRYCNFCGTFAGIQSIVGSARRELIQRQLDKAEPGRISTVFGGAK